MLSGDPAVCLEGSCPYAPHTVNVGPREERKKPHIITRNRDYCWRAVRIDSLRNGFWQRKFEGFEGGKLASYNVWFDGVRSEYC